MAEHTPGPWTWRYDRLTAADESVEILDTNEHGYDGMFGGVPPNEADAHLIAAAPDLLAALEALVDRAVPSEMTTALAAIAKATGKDA